MIDTPGIAHHATLINLTVSGRQRVTVSPHVAKSWNRCLNEYGMEPAGARATAVLEPGQLRERQQRMGELLGVARAEMESLYDQIAGSGYAVLLTDADATILSTITDPTLKREFRDAGLWPGAVWDERHEGTNGLGTCVAEGAPVTVHREEHFRDYNIRLSCSGAPIRAIAFRSIFCWKKRTATSRRRHPAMQWTRPRYSSASPRKDANTACSCCWRLSARASCPRRFSASAPTSWFTESRIPTISPRFAR